MAIERHPFQFFLAGIADKLKGEDMAITFLHMDEDGYLDKTVSEIFKCAQESIVILEIDNNDIPDNFGQIVYYYGWCTYRNGEFILMFFSVDSLVNGTLTMQPYQFAAEDIDDNPVFFD